MKRLSATMLGLFCLGAQAQHATATSASCGSFLPALPLECHQSSEALSSSAKAFADFGVLRVYGKADQTGATTSSAFAVATASFYDTLTISTPGRTGQSGKVIFRMPVSYSFSTYVNGGTVSTALLDGRLAIGITPRAQELNKSMLDVEVRRTAAGETVTRFETEKPGTDRTNGVIELQYSFVFGTAFRLNASLDATATALGASSGAIMDSFQSATWGGVSSLTTADGLAVAYSITSSSGFDYSQPYSAPVPEPSAWALMFAGLGLLALLRLSKGG
ncbi:MAG TPA: PEP-CTERM sorting domain-containing protein [Roseateles sp.]